MVTHFQPQMPTKNGQIPQSAHSRQGASLRRGSVERDADAECPLSPRVMSCPFRDVIVLLPTGPSTRLGLLSAHDEHPDQWSSLVLRDLLVISTSEFGLEAKLGDPGDHWPVWVSDMILRPAKWKAMLARARTEDWWNDPSDRLDEDALECGNIDHSRVPVAFTIEQRHTGCERMGIANQCQTTSRATALSALGATSTFRASQSQLTMHRTEAKGATTRSCCRSHDETPFPFGAPHTHLR